MKIDFYKEIKSRYGNVRRARGFYLYTEKNIRLLDLYLDNDLSVFGRKKNQSPLVFKQFVDKGLFSFLPSQADANLNKALTELFPDCKFKFSYSYSEGLKMLGLKNTLEDIEKNLWRPFLPSANKLKEHKAFFIQPPICTALKILAIKKDEDEQACADGVKNFDSGCIFGDNAFIPAAEKAAIARAFFDLIKKIREKERQATLYSEQTIEKINNKNRRKQILSNLKQREVLIKRIEPFWDLQGIYLYPKMQEAEYETFFKKALDNRILISPNFATPSILPELDNYKIDFSF